MKKIKKPQTWIKPRHTLVRNLACMLLNPYCQWKYGVQCEPFIQQGKRSYLVLANHQTPFDQFFIGISFKGPVYYMATEDIFSLGFISSLIKWLVAPIPIKKQTTDIAAVKNCVRVSREGGTIAIFPEGNRTYSGKTEHISPAIASLARMLKLPIALYRIEGGYGVQPRWSDCIRKGKMRGYVSRVIEPEEYANLSPEELFAQIEEGLRVREGTADASFLSNRRAEYLERAMYVCPHCGLTRFESHGNEVECLSCRRKVTYGADKRLTGAGHAFPFRFVSEWYDYQKAFVNALPVTTMTNAPLFCDQANISEVILYKKKRPLRENAALRLYGDRITVDENTDSALILPFDEVSVAAVLGRNKLNIYHKDKVYQFKGDKRFNALKYVNICYRYKNIVKGDTNGKFLGL